MVIVPRQNDLLSSASGIKDTFSSWGNCMNKDYCKYVELGWNLSPIWRFLDGVATSANPLLRLPPDVRAMMWKDSALYPVIVGIIIGSLILLTILSCLMRCICCGKDIVCCCWRCCGGRKSHKHLDSVPPTPYNQQYQSHAPPIYGGPPPVYAGPAAFMQTATFESPSKVHEDSLPAMPSWETAASRKVEVIEEPESHEMDHLKGDTSPNLRSGDASPLPRPMPMRDGSDNSIQQSPRLPAVGMVGRSPYGSDANVGPYGSRTNVSGLEANSPYASRPNISNPDAIAPYGSRANLHGDGNTGPYGSRTNFNGSNADFQGSRSNLVQRDEFAYRGSNNNPYSPSVYSPNSPQTRQGYGNDAGYENRPEPYGGTYNRPGGSPIYNSGSPVHGQPRNNGGYTAYQPANSQSPVNDRYGQSSANNGGQRPYGGNPYDRNPAAGSWRNI